MSFTENHWNNIYKTRDHTQVGWYQESPEISIQLLSELDFDKSKSIIDVGCGASVLVDNLIEQKCKSITLLDLSSEALSITQSRLGKQSSIPKYLVQDITKSDLNYKYDFWHDRAVFHFLLIKSDRNNYIKNLTKNLNKNGRAIIGTFSLEGPQTCSGLDVERYDKEKMKKVLGEALMVERTVSSTHVMPNNKTQEYMYFIIKHKNA